jgi:uncharacterized protein (TIGR02145 family)
MKLKLMIVSGFFIALLMTLVWSCKKDDHLNGNPSLQGAFTDPRDGYVYKTIIVDSLIWFADNLDYDPAGAVDYPEKSANAENYVKLYNWTSAKAACPEGWQLASNNQWGSLLISLGMSPSVSTVNGFNGTDRGKKLKSTTGWLYNGNGTDEIGFGGLPAGWRRSNGEFTGKGEYAMFWTSTLEAGLGNAYTRTLLYGRDDVRQDPMTIDYVTAASVRCVTKIP